MERHILVRVALSPVKPPAERDTDRNYILKELPEGFVLWEHVKYKVDGSAEDKKQKGKHAAGPYERQDAYLYGHPQGRKKRYRSPADFFPHLIWLATDKENDRRNCSCKICSPDGDEETQVETVKAEVVKKEVKPPAPIVMKGNLYYELMRPKV